VTSGSTLTYTIAVTSLGPDEANNVLINDVTPAGIPAPASPAHLREHMGMVIPGGYVPVGSHALHQYSAGDGNSAER
jgi:hypothetical protein